MASSIAESFDKALRAFKGANPKHRPRRIIIYRDDPGGRGSLNALVYPLSLSLTSPELSS